MVKLSAVIGICVTLFISLILPIIAATVWKIKNKDKKILSAWLIGAAGFFVMQILIRMPILNFIAASDKYTLFMTNHYALFCIALAFTAALFEVVGRYAAAKLMRKNLTFERAAAAGLGHGGIEAIIIVGLTYINNLIYAVMINTGNFDSIVEQSAAAGVDTSVLLTVKEVLVDTNTLYFFLAGYERLLTMSGHLALSLIVCYFVSRKKDMLGIAICTAAHFILDFVSIFVNGLTTEYMGNIITTPTAYTVIYIFLTIVAAVSAAVIIKIKNKWVSENLISKV